MRKDTYENPIQLICEKKNEREKREKIELRL